MSSAHRPTWNPRQASGDNRHVSKIASVRDLPAQTQLKFRQSESEQQVPSSSDHGNDTRLKLREQLEQAERDARNKKRKAAGLELEEAPKEQELEEELSEGDDAEVSGKKPKLLAPGTDSDASEDEDDEEELDDAEIEARARAILKEQRGSASDDDDDEDEDDEDDEDEDDDEDDDEDETAMLMKELEKIKAEKAAAAAQKAREEEEARELREAEIAKGNPLLNSGMTDASSVFDDTSSMAGASTASFGVKRRWDDDVIFKNQTASAKPKNADFVNDLQRSEFHKEFLHRFIK